MLDDVISKVREQRASLKQTRLAITPGLGNDVLSREMKQRIDKLLLERGLVPSRERAQAMILAGRVMVREQRVDKAGTLVDTKAPIRLLGEELRYVSRGGLKLEKALQHWKVEVRGWTCMDVGASTGGFTDCLLQHGAARVIAVDTGKGQMHTRVRNDPRVRLLENTNARYLTPEQIGEAAQLVAVDVSFISAAMILPAVINAAFATNPENGGEQHVIVLVKPQFEAGREHVGKGGIVRDPQAQAAAVNKVRDALAGLGFEVRQAIESPILGAQGNKEFLLHGLRHSGRESPPKKVSLA